MATQIASDLDIDIPKISFADATVLGTKMAAIEMPGRGNLLIKKNLSLPETVLALAHELRHLWQIKQGVFNDSITYDRYIDSKDNLEEYALQPCEVDANAYAQIVCVDLLGIKPIWKGYSVQVKAAIEKRVGELCGISNADC